mmetsp:Transcript_24190/g.68968  ORF Transcript_24190/g.68968 Transcript_24190/m.68968 type:complete len:316 (-) Transcript_24190:13-960(-)
MFLRFRLGASSRLGLLLRIGHDRKRGEAGDVAQRDTPRRLVGRGGESSLRGRLLLLVLLRGGRLHDRDVLLRGLLRGGLVLHGVALVPVFVQGEQALREVPPHRLALGHHVRQGGLLPDLGRGHLDRILGHHHVELVLLLHGQLAARGQRAPRGRLPRWHVCGRGVRGGDRARRGVLAAPGGPRRDHVAGRRADDPVAVKILPSRVARAVLLLQNKLVLDALPRRELQRHGGPQREGGRIRLQGVRLGRAPQAQARVGPDDEDGLARPRPAALHGEDHAGGHVSRTLRGRALSLSLCTGRAGPPPGPRRAPARVR